MKLKFLLLYLLIPIFIFSCPSYQLAEKSPEELEAEFNAVTQTIIKDFEDLESNFGSYSYTEFKKLVSDWMELYTKYECWFDITQKKQTRVPMKKSKDWLDNLKNISVLLGEAVNHFTSKDYRHSREKLRKAKDEFITRVIGTKYNIENEYIKKFNELLKNKDYSSLIAFYRKEMDQINTIQGFIKTYAKKFDLDDYSKIAGAFFKKLSVSIDKEEELDYTRDELINLLNKYSFYRFSNSDQIKKMWIEVNEK